MSNVCSVKASDGAGEQDFGRGKSNGRSPLYPQKRTLTDRPAMTL